MAILYWRGSAAYNGGDWNVAANWYTPYLFGATGSAPVTVLTPAGRTPYANDSVKILNALPFPITGTTTSNTPILANCSTGGMQNFSFAGGLTYNWVNAPAGSSYGPLASLEIGISAAPATGYTYTHFTFNPDGSIPLFWKSASEVLSMSPSWMPGTETTNSYWTSKLYGVLNPGYGATAHNLVSAFVHSTFDYNTSLDFSYYNKLDLSLKGKIGKFEIPPYPGHYFFGDVTVEPNTTVNVMEIRGDPTNILLPLGCTCSSLVIQPTKLFNFPTNIQVQCSVGITANQYSSASANNYGEVNFRGIKFRADDTTNGDFERTNVSIGYPIGNTAANGSPATLYYNLWEEDRTDTEDDLAPIMLKVQGSCFINDMLLEDSRLSISAECNEYDTIAIKKGELRGYSRLDLRRDNVVGGNGNTLGVPAILGPYAAANRGQTGAEGVLLSSRSAQFTPHPMSTISF